MVAPLEKSGRVLSKEHLASFFAGVTGVHPQALTFAFPGPSIPLIKELPNLDPEDVSAFKVFKEGEAVSVLKEMVDHWLMGKFTGPWPHWVRYINDEEIKFLPTFTIPKGDSTTENPKNRVLINASHEHPSP